ncbi:lantibiotic dehydratase [Solwaraspora sp. WMMD406]|uniref:lantibiotic dehydratase n=1 Tax=Solwaraspora sp. WMMD406 TaxID=3016095 RepID=UPI002417D730|nr:lantibiotic dehydratase [Solwaraspora sp. WMMD406]MDG4768524.1 lantibiotic dehydratase [Solwaraspora sp. WMMD406]
MTPDAEPTTPETVRMPEPDTHRIPLDGDWALWQWFCLRATGFPFELLDQLADPELARLADEISTDDGSGGGTDDGTGSGGGTDDGTGSGTGPASGSAAEERYRALFGESGRRVGQALHRLAADPRIREAVAWQNPQALTTGFDTLLRRDPDTVARTGRHRRTEALITSYLHRYCAKNDTIGFFGPLRWGRIDPRQAAPIVRTDDGTGGDRTLYLEGWAVAALGRALAAPLRPWLVPRLLPQFDVRAGRLTAPGHGAVPLDPLTAAVLDALAPGRTAREVVDVVRTTRATHDAGPEQVWAVLEKLLRDQRIEWTLEVPADELAGLTALRAAVHRVDDPALRAAALGPIDHLDTALAAVADARGDATAVRQAVARLGETFTEITGSASARQAGQLYAGRTLVFEECRQPDSVTLGPAALDSLRAPLALVLAGARWYTAAGAALYRRALREVFDEVAAGHPGRPVPFVDFWLAARDLLLNAPGSLVDPLVRVLAQRWSRLLGVGAGHAAGAEGSPPRRVRRTAADLADDVAAAFPAGRPGWPAAVQHSPDLMIAAADLAAIVAGDVDWVLGEIHPGYHTMRYASWVDCHPDPAALAATMRADLPDGVVRVGATDAQGGTATRFSPLLRGPAQRRLVLIGDTNDGGPGHDGASRDVAAGQDGDRDFVLGRCDLVDRDGTLLVRRRLDGAECELIEVVADLIAASLMPHFRLLPAAAHQPRVSIDRLVVSRETWRIPVGEVGFADLSDEADRFLAVRRWAAGLGLPRHVFVRVTGEAKPMHVDLTSLASVEVLSRMVRRAGRADPAGTTNTTGTAGTAQLVVSEMLPGPDQLWLTDPDGRRYSCEFRFVAADRSTAGNGSAAAS